MSSPYNRYICLNERCVEKECSTLFVTFYVTRLSTKMSINQEELLQFQAALNLE